MDQNNSTGGYSKKMPVWAWVLVYVVVGGLVYGMIYYFAIAKKGGYNINTANYNYNYNAPANTNTGVIVNSNTSITPNTNTGYPY